MSAWFKHGFWNTLEHALTRVADAATTLVLLWVLSTENFSTLALAQAWVAPILLLFVSPETAIYRDYARWKNEGARALAAKLHALRLFAVGKGQFALVLALVIGLAAPFAGNRWDSVCALLWAFALALAPQISGPDREFLRLDLKLKPLNAISLYQKLTNLGGTVLVSWIWPGQIHYLAAVALFSALTSAVYAKIESRKALRELDPSFEPRELKPSPELVVAVLSESLKTFSLWHHVSWVVIGWIQTMDLFFIGLFQTTLALPVKEVGLYAAVLKLANFAHALPNALANLFGVRVGRKAASPEITPQERSETLKLTLALLAINAAQAIFLWLLSPWALDFLSRGRWTEDEQRLMRQWFAWILAGSALASSGYLLSLWHSLRGSIASYFFQVTLPWGLISLAIYAAAVYWGGMTWAAQSNVAVSITYLLLLSIFTLRSSRR